MTDDFFVELGETLSKTAKDLGIKADSFFEGQKIRTKIMSEQRLVDQAMEDIGNIIYQKYIDGGAVDQDVTELCEEITERKVAIAQYRETVSKMKGEKVCPACGASIPMEASFCMRCGTPCKTEEEPAKETEKESAEPSEAAGDVDAKE